MQPPEDLKGRPIAGGVNSPTQGTSGLLEKILYFHDCHPYILHWLNVS